VNSGSPWRNLSEMDLSFKRSRRRASARRERAARARPPTRLRSAKVLLAATLLLAFAGEISGMDPAAIAQTGRATAVRLVAAEEQCPIPDRFRPAFVAAADATGVPLALLVAVAWEESRMDPDARSHAGAEGLLQLMPTTAAEVQVDARTPAGNVLAGALYLQRMLERFENADLALAAYNAGPTAVERAGGAPSGETRAYVANVTARWRELAGCS